MVPVTRPKYLDPGELPASEKVYTATYFKWKTVNGWVTQGAIMGCHPGKFKIQEMRFSFEI
jgi:hypothetical protein